MSASPKKSLRLRLSLWTFAASGLLIGAVLIFYAIFTYRLFLSDYEKELENRMEIVAASLKLMVEKMDYMGMVVQANSLMITQGVVGVKILDGNKHPLIQKGTQRGFYLQQPIWHKNEQIGTIEVVFSNTSIKEKVKALFLFGIAITIIGLPLTALLMWLVSGRQIKDILDLSREVHQIGDIESENIHLSGMKRHDEIGHLARSLAERSNAIRNSIKQEQLLYSAINQSYDSVVITDADANIVYVNPAFSRITGYASKEIVGQNPRILQSGKHPPKFYDVMWRTLTKGDSWKGLIINKRKNGEEYQEEATITPVLDREGQTHHYVAMKRDVTQEVVLKRKLARAEKMQAIGLMAGGVAHDLNNILSGIIGYPELILMQLPGNSKLRNPIQEIHESGKRASIVVADLLTIARGAAAAREVHNLNFLILEFLDSPEYDSIKALYPNVIIIQELDADKPNISCSPVHIKKCLMNLITNAAEAIGNSGRINITTYNKYFDCDATDTLDLTAGEYVVVEVRDTGPGISDEDIEHIFEPFYTKKKMGRSGTGLGLAVVWNTVKDHNGKIFVKSGTTGASFEIIFPVSTHTNADMVEEEKLENLMGNGEHILVVDDEAQLRDVAGKMLQTLGYRVDSVSSGELALEFVKKHPVDLLLIDMFMDPGMNGRQTYEELLKLYPDQRAIIASGYSESKDVVAALKMGAGGFIGKPYSIRDLGGIVKDVLGNASS